MYHEQINRRFTNGFCALAIMHLNALDLPPEARAEAKQMSDNPGSNLKAIAQVILGTGFGAAATRAVASGLMLVRKTKVPTKLFDDVASGLTWLMPNIKPVSHHGKPVPEEFLLGLEQIQKQGQP